MNEGFVGRHESRFPVLATLSAVIAATLLASVPVLFGSPEPQVHIRWRDVSDPERMAIERQFALTESMLLGQNTWSYTPVVTTPELIRTIVCHPALQDTSGIDRSGFALSNSPPLSPRRNGMLQAPLMARGVKLLGYLFAGLAAGLFGYAALVSPRLPFGRTARRVAESVAVHGLRPVLAEGLRAGVTRGIPELRAEVVGVFRFFYAVFLAFALISDSARLAPGRVADGWPDWGWIAWLVGRADLMALLENGLFVVLALFAVGLCSRVAYWLIAAGMTTYALASTQSYESTVHVWMIAIFTILCLIPVPWHETPLSVDEVIRRWRNRPSARGLRGKAYGYAVWMPGLVVGTVWASAAYSKLEGGLGWVLGGAVKYHWVIDAAKGTPVEWGLWVASHHWASVLMSFCGVLFEAVFLLAVFARPGVWRYGLTLTGLFLLTGFFLFHNVLWWPWWLVYLSFAIPWSELYDFAASRFTGWFRAVPPSAAVPSPEADRNLHPVHMVMIALVCVHATLQLPAGFGRFGSYANTYASTAAFDLVNPIPPVERLWIDDGTGRLVEVSAAPAATAIRDLSNDTPLPVVTVEWIRANPEIRTRVRVQPSSRLTLTRQRQAFDWTQGQFQTPDTPVVVGWIELDSMRVIKTSMDVPQAACS